jgi:UDP-N-acetylglucosamine--N-acetylmuramyl-(pentapeptide) pyrophosphoryl-undecaprenol N-acetylglucosamine transferase
MSAFSQRPAPAAESGLVSAGSNLRVVVAGGGTGGHLYPALAIAEAIREAAPGAQVQFLGSSHGLEARVLPERGERVWLLETARLRGLGPLSALRSLGLLQRAIRQARKLLVDFAPHVVVGVGGYASAAGLAAAAMLGIPRAIHEQNAVPGWTNRVGARLSHRVYASFDASASSLPSRRLLVVGNPVRRAVAERKSRACDPQPHPELHVLVMGGSQGARFLNEQAPGTLAELARTRAVEVLHQTGEREAALVEERYRRLGLRAEVVPFITDMGAAYAWADVAICRAGASTVAELAAVGLPAVLVPFPHAAGDHQTANATTFARLGGGFVVQQRDWAASEVARKLAGLDRAALHQRAVSARSLARPDAAAVLVKDLLQWLESSGRFALPSGGAA